MRASYFGPWSRDEWRCLVASSTDGNLEILSREREILLLSEGKVGDS